jgi:hypothetical protein
MEERKIIERIGRGGKDEKEIEEYSYSSQDKSSKE